MKTNYTAEKISFWQLISKEDIENVEIPIIQRDYKQGSEKHKKLRKKFIEALKEAFDNHIELDFIYGNKKNNIFFPIDGQQRLTTLFLLHWYLVVKEKKITEEIKKKLSKFTYETRISSRKFCENLARTEVDFDALLNDRLSDTITDFSWFYDSWHNDPTIEAMLGMLDEIHNNFKDTNNLWDKLIKEEDNPITFYYIILENFGLSDDLYIKMNARGKQLTDFEVFKAELERKIEKEEWDKSKPIIGKFEHKIDTEWLDIFWKKAKEKFDIVYFNFIVYTLLPKIALKKIKKEDKEKLIRNIFNNLQNISINLIDQDDYNFLYKVLDRYVDNTEFKTSVLFWEHLNGKNNFFDLLVSEIKLTYKQVVFLYAQNLSLLTQKKLNEDWIRVVRNIIINSDIDSAETFVSAVNLITELSTGISNIYEYLSTINLKSGFAKEQVKEEILKAQIIKKDINNKKIIFNTEDTNFCKGRISFALYCADSETANIFSKNNLLEITKVIEKYLSDNYDISNSFRSGLLTIKDNKFYLYWRSWLHAVSAPKYCLIEDIDELKYFAYNQFFREYLKLLLLDLTKKDLDILLNDYNCPENMPRWKCKLIKNPRLLDYSNKHYIAVPENESCCYLIPQSRVANNEEGRKKLKKIK